MTILFSCKDSQYVINQKDKTLKYQYAMKWYSSGNYFQAIPVIEDLMAYYKGTDTAEQLYFMLAESYFNNKEFMVSAYHFKTFKEIYPRSFRAEVASFKIAECYRQEIPRIDLEQTDTEKAIEHYSTFISEFPKSTMVDQAYTIINKLKRNLELKALASADLYYHTGNYRAAAVSYKNVLNQYPNISEYEELMYKIGSSYFKFAEKSIVSKQTERYELAMNEGQNFLNRFPNSKHKSEVATNVELSKTNILESSLKNASTFFNLSERPLYFQQSLGLYEEFGPEIKNKTSSILSYKDQCYLGILKAHYLLFDEAKDIGSKNKLKNQFLEQYHNSIEKFTAKSTQLYEAEELYKKLNLQYKS